MTGRLPPDARASTGQPLQGLRSTGILLLFLLTLLVAGANAQAMCFVSGGFSEGVPEDPTLARTTLCWNPVNPVPATHDIEHVFWNPALGEYLAVGAGGAVLASPDGIDWIPRDTGTTQRLYGGLWDGERYIVVGDGGLLMTSPDGEVWTGQDTNTRARLLDVAVNAVGRYVVVGEEGTVLTSTDATSWTRTTVLSLSRRPALYGVVARNNRFVAVGSSTAIISSTDGINWTEHSYVPLAPPGQPQPVVLRDVAVSPSGVYVAVGGNAAVYTSSNGETWNPTPPINDEPDARLRRVIRVDGIGVNYFLAVGDSGDSDDPLILQSNNNGLNWSNISSSLPGDVTPTTLKTIAYNGTGLVTAGNRSLLQTPTTALEWQAVTPDPDLVADLRDLITAAFPPARAHLAVGAGGAVLSSPDGLTWARENSGTDASLNGVAARRDGNGQVERIVAVGDNGVIRYTDDGDTWAPADSGTDADLMAVTYGDSSFIAVGLDGTIIISADGATWSPPASGSFDADLFGVAYSQLGDAAGFVAVGSGGTVISSVDGANWDAVNPGLTGTLHAILWKGDDTAPRFVAVGQTAGASPSAAAIYSTNGADWSVAAIPTPAPPAQPVPPLRAVAWNGRQYIAASDGGLFLRSPSGQGWTTIGNAPVESIPRIDALAWSGDRFLAAGEGGRIAGSGGIDLAVGVNTDVSVSEDDSPFFGNAGVEKTYRFTISNLGHVDATNVTFTYTPPPDISALAAANAPANWSCTAPNDATGLSCSIGRLAAGADDAVVIAITMTLPVESDITITHRVALVSDPADAQPANNTLAVATRLGQRPAPGLPSPDTDFSSRGAFGAVSPLGLLLLALFGGLFRRLPARAA